MRVVVGMRCEAPCTSCSVCTEGGVAPSPSDVLAAVGDSEEIVLGGGDATRWHGLDEFLATRARRVVRLEAPLGVVDEEGVAARLRRLGVTDVTLLVDVTRLARGDDGVVVQAVERVERHGLRVSPRLCARPVAFGRLASLARALSPRIVRLELVRQDVGQPPGPIPSQALEEVVRVPGVRFAADRRADTGYLPPCAMPHIHRVVGEVWAEALAPGRAGRNHTLPACTDCDLADRCRFTDRGALAPSASSPPTGKERGARPEVRCLEPWLKMELTDPVALVHQCCSDWTVGPRGDRRTSTLREIWNGTGYREARRAMLEGNVGELCRPICPRLHDDTNAASRFAVMDGSPAFVQNQEWMLEDLAARRDTLRSLPLTIGLCPSTYCNFDCIMCGYGRSPRRDIPDDVWDELPVFLPTLATLVLLGGEPLANPRTMTFLRSFDVARWPDVGISLTTNGSFFTRGTLRHLERCPFASIIVSVNAGTAEVYEAVQRGTSFATLLENLDALVEFRAARRRPFDLRAGFVVQPASVRSLVEFGELSAVRGLGIRLLPLHANSSHSLDYYDDPDAVARVVEALDGFARWAARRRPDWLVEIGAVRAAIVAEAARVGTAQGPGVRRKLPLAAS